MLRVTRRLPVGLLGLHMTILLSQPVSGAETVQSLRYGVSLFHFYQQDYFDALTELMVGQAREELGPHTDGSELLRGGMSLSYGMDREAEAIFKRQLALAEEHKDRDRAWFFLGKAAWQRGDVERTLSSLDGMSDRPDGALLSESLYLRASAALRNGDATVAASLLDSIEEGSKWEYYLRYNLAADRAAEGDWSAAQAHFAAFDAMPLDSAEHVALFERAQTAAGYAFLAADEPGMARYAFERVSLEGHAADKALLGFGWAAVREGDYPGALSAWQPLTSRSMLYATARESLLATPYAYEQLGHANVALTHYRTASTVYAEQLDSLNQAIAVFRDGPIDTLLGLDGESPAQAAVMGWVDSESILPEGEFAPYLQFLVTRHSFQVALRELRDLYDMRHRLRGALKRLAVLHEVDGHQQAVWQDVMAGQEQQALRDRRQVLLQQYGQLLDRLGTAERSDDHRAFADVAQRERWTRLDRALDTARDLGRPEQAQKLERLRGLQIWQDNERLPQQLWEAKRSLRVLEQQIARSAEAMAAVDAAIAQRQGVSAAPRIDALRLRTAQQLDVVDRVITRAESGTRQLAVATLEEQAEQLQRALGQSGLAIARLYDLNSARVEP